MRKPANDFFSSIFCLWLLLFLLSCQEENQGMLTYQIQGHRGCRGLMPENSLEGFIKAVELGVTTLEMDVVISKDNQVVVSHEPFMSYRKCLTPEGKEFGESEEMGFNLYQMDYDLIRKFDCGSKYNEAFPEQQKLATYKPLLGEVLDTIVYRFPLKNIRYNIELKSLPEGDFIHHPDPQQFCNLVLAEIRKRNLESRVILQSFDFRILQYLKEAKTSAKLALLVENELSFEENLERLGFKPDIYSPWFPYVDSQLVALCRKNQLKIIPWTVNEPDDIERMVNLQVDEIITDYPNRFQKVNE
jgi:glycerophosphoryl diester phosphodiesterase